MTSRTERNFDDFNNMFKGINHKAQTPDEVALMVVEKVKREHNSFRLDDVVAWFDESHFYKVRSWVEDEFDSDVSDIED